MKKLFGIGSMLLVLSIVGSTAFGALVTIGNSRPVAFGVSSDAAGGLQAQFNAKGIPVNTLTQQLPYDYFVPNYLDPTAEFKLMFEFAGNNSSNVLGIYSLSSAYDFVAGTGSLDKIVVFPGAAGNFGFTTDPWKSEVSFNTDTTVTVEIKKNTVVQSNVTYSGFSGNAFGFYLEGPGGTFYSDDAMNDNANPQFLAFLDGSNVTPGWIFAFEDLPYPSSDKDFQDLAFHGQSLNPVPEPGTMMLLGSGLVGLAGWGRKKFRK